MEEPITNVSETPVKKPKGVTAKLILGIISMVLFALVTFQSFAAGLSNILSDNGEVSGFFGFIVAFNLLVSGIIAVAARKSIKKAPWIIAAILLWLNLFFSKAFAGSYSDLVIWGFVSFFIGLFYLLSSVRKIRGYIIVGVLAILMLLIAEGVGRVTATERKDTPDHEVQTPSSVVSEGQSTQVNVPDVKTKTEKPTETKSSTKATVTIEEAVLLDQGGIKITAKSIDMKGLFGPAVKMLFENSTEKSVTIQVRNASVNGYMIEPSISVDVAPGKKANDSMTFSNSDLETTGIKTIADIEFSFHVFDSTSWDTIFDSDIIRIETNEAKGFQYTFDDSGNQVYYDKGVEIVFKGLAKENSWLGKEAIVYIHNESDRNITVQVRNVSVNGFMVDPFFSCDVVAGKHAVDSITFSTSELEKNGIETIKNIELSFHIFDADSWDTIADSPIVTLTFD